MNWEGLKRFRDGFNDAGPLSHLPYHLSDRVRKKLPPDIKHVVELAEVCHEAHNLAKQTFAEIKDYFTQNPAFRPYWNYFVNQYEMEEIPPYRLKAFVCWFAATQGGSIRTKRHLRLVADNGPVVSKYFPQEPTKVRKRKRLTRKS